MIEIDLKDLLVKLVKKWKSIALVVILSMIIGGIFSVAAGKALVMTGGPDPRRQALEKTESAAAPLGQSQREAVEDNYDNYLSLVQMRDDMQNYIDNSEFMQLRIGEGTEIRTVYVLKADSNLNPVIHSYQELLINREMADEVNDELDRKISVNDLSNMCSVTDQQNTGIIEIENESEKGKTKSIVLCVMSKDEETGKAIQKAADKRIKELTDSFSEVHGKYTIKEVGSVTGEITTDTLLVYQKKYLDSLNSINATILNMKNRMSNEEKAYFESLAAYGKELTKEQDETVSETGTEISKRIVVKYMILFGFVFGFLIVAWYAGLYIFGGKLHKAEFLKRRLGIDVLCRMKGDDRVVALEELKYIAQQNESGKVGVVTSCEDMREILSNLIKDTHSEQIISLEKRPVSDEDFEKVGSVNCVVFVEKEEVSRIKEIEETAAYYIQKKIPLCGVIIAE